MPDAQALEAPDFLRQFAGWNRRFQEGARAERCLPLRQRYAALRDDFVTRYGGHLIRPLGVPLLFPQRAFRRLAAAGQTLLTCQQKMLRALAARHSPSELLDLFLLPPRMAGLMDWHALLNGPTPLVRHDVLITPGGDFRFCEINVDSAIGGSESAELARLFGEAWRQASAESVPFPARWRPPQADIAALIAERARARHCERVVFLDWSTWAAKGFFSYKLLAEAVQRELGDLPVLLTDETAYPGASAGAAPRGDLVFRCFLYEDIQDCPEYVEALLRSSREVLYAFECEVLSSKLWFALFHDEALTAPLSDEERACIAQYVPYTAALSPANAPRFLEDREHYVFKDVSSYGGHGVYRGADHDADFLEGLFRETSHRRWVAQALVEQPLLPVAVSPSLATEQHRVVLGLYQTNGRSSGFMIRTHPTLGVINQSLGAHIGWGIVLDEDAQWPALAAALPS
jgi:hypothetical protein